MIRNIKSVILAVAFVKIAGIFYFDIHPETFENHDIAINFLSTGTMFYAHDGNVDYNHQFPLYDLFLSLLFLLTNTSLKAALCMQVFANLISCILIYNISQKILRNLDLKIIWLPYFMAIICCVHPFLLYYQLFNIHPLTFDILLLLLLVWISFLYIEKPSAGFMLILILTAGLTGIERITLLVAIVPFFFLLKIRPDNKVFIRYFLSVTSGVLIFSGSWVLRNYYHTGELQLTSGVYRYLWIGSLEETNGTNYADSATNYYGLLSKYGISLEGKSLHEQSENYKLIYNNKWNHKPGVMFKMFFVRCKTFWWFPDNAGGQYNERVRHYIFLYKIVYGLLLVLAVSGIFVSGKKALIWLSLPVSLCLIQGIFYMEVRHRMPAEFILWFFATVGLWRFFNLKTAK